MEMGKEQRTVLSAQSKGGSPAANHEAASSIWKHFAKFSQNFHALQENLSVMSFPNLSMNYFSFWTERLCEEQCNGGKTSSAFLIFTTAKSDWIAM